jgi:hypothetical protein
MNTVDWVIIGIATGIITGLIAVIYTGLMRRIDAMQTSSKNGLALKVDNTEFRVTKEWQQDVFDNMKIVIKELKDENNIAHAGILLELKKISHG